jgi:hypothetical protein
VELLPAEAGMNRFVWDLRVEDPVQIPGAFYSDEGPKGPVVNPGMYTVRISMRDSVQSAPLEVVLDPRLKNTVTANDLTAHWDLVHKTVDDIEALHRAVNQIRAVRKELDTAQPAGATKRSALTHAAANFDGRMSRIEEELIQVNMKASEDNLRYPNKLDEQYDTFIATIDGEDIQPTGPQLDVFTELHDRLTRQLTAWKSLQDHELTALSSDRQRSGVGPVNVPSGAGSP